MLQIQQQFQQCIVEIKWSCVPSKLSFYMGIFTKNPPILGNLNSISLEALECCKFTDSSSVARMQSENANSTKVSIFFFSNNSISCR